MSKKKRLSDRAVFAILIIAVPIIVVYLLFFAYFPKAICIFDDTSKTISEEQAAKECPKVILTDYDREFLDGLIEDERVRQLESSEKYASIRLKADEGGFPRYAPREDENYTLHADHNMYGMNPLFASIQFEDKGILYKERLFICVQKEDNGNDYSKSVSVIRADGKFIDEYWYSDGEYSKTTYRYGLINHIKGFIDAIMSV